MIRYVSWFVLVAWMGLLSGCGAPAAGETAATGEHGEALRGEARGRDGAVSRSSAGADGHASDLAFFRGRLQELRATPGADPKLAAGMAEIVAKLEGLTVESGGPSLQGEKTGYLCGAYYGLEAHAYPGFAYGNSDASAGYTEFGPPSPWSKTLYTYAYASSGVYTEDEYHSGTFSGAGMFEVLDSTAVTGPDFCQHLIGFSYINANGCPNGFRSEYVEMRTCP